MPITRQKKEEIIKKVADVVENSQSVVFVNFHGLSVTDANDMRQEFRNRGVGYIVAKKTLVRRVLDSAGLSGEAPPLEGELALAYLLDGVPAKAGGDNMVLPAKGVMEFKKKFKDVIVPLGGIMGGRYISIQEVKALAAIPGREALLGQCVIVLNAPIQKTGGVLHNIVGSFINILNQVVETKSS